MTIKAAGILFTHEKQALYLLRGAGGDFPGHWCFPGGKQEEGETPEQCAERETVEEIGHLPEGKRKLWTRSQSIAAGVGEELTGAAQAGEIVDFTTYLQPVSDQFIPETDGEHVGFCWAPINEPPQPMHPGCQIALDKFGMDELGVAQAIRDGQLTSPQVYENISLYDIRITGTGVAYRQALDEFVMRKSENYLNDEFLARCNGLPVIMEHPPTAVLNTEEFANRTIGTVFLPYIKDDEVWGIAKIYDSEAAEMMAKDQLSTSPAVVFRDPAVNDKLVTEDGSTLLIEGAPSLLDHIAICSAGVWDKGGDPVGVVSADIGDMTMAEVEQRDDAADEEDIRARKDADAGEKLDKLLAHLDSLSKRLDSLEAEPEAKDDAEEVEDPISQDEPKRVAADEEEMERVKKDSQEVRSRIAQIERMLPRQITDAEYAAMADAQAGADKVYAAFGDSAPRPLQGEDLGAYRRRLANGLKAHSSAWKSVDLGKLPEEALAIAEGQIYADAMGAARNPADVPDGELRVIRSHDATGRQHLSFVGSPRSWMRDFSSSRRYLTGVNKQH